MIKRSILALLVMLLTLAGCATDTTATRTAEPTSPDPTTEEPTAAPTNEMPPTLPEGYTLYESDEAGFAIGYPEGWFVTETGEGITYLTSFDLDDAPATDGIPAGETKVDILVSDPPRAESAEAFVSEQREDNQAIDTTITNVEELTVLGGSSAVLITSEGQRGTSQTFYTVYNGKGILITPFGNEDPFATMIDTIRPLEPMVFPAPDAVIEAVAEAVPDAAPENITITSAERVEWNNACLEAADEGEVCAEVITPGWRVMVDADGTPVEVHTNEDASDIRIGE